MDPTEKSASEQINDIVSKTDGWRGAMLADLRAVVLQADSGITEEVKWKKPSKPEGIPVWVRGGNVCMADTLKNAVRLTFPKGAQLADPKHIFNTRLDSKTVRAVDFFEDSVVDKAGLRELVAQAAKLGL